MKAATDDREVLKVEEAAALMRVTKNTAYELIANEVARAAAQDAYHRGRVQVELGLLDLPT